MEVAERSSSTRGAGLTEGAADAGGPHGSARPNGRVVAALHVLAIVGLGAAIGAFAWEPLGRPTAWLRERVTDMLPVADADLDPTTCGTTGSIADLGCQARSVLIASSGAIVVAAFVLVFRREVAAALRWVGRGLPQLVQPVVGPIAAAVVFTMAYADMQDHALSPLSGRSPIPEAAVPAAVGLLTYVAVAIGAHARGAGRGVLATLRRIPAPIRVFVTVGVALGLGVLAGSGNAGSAAGLALRSQIVVVGSTALAALLMAPFHPRRVGWHPRRLLVAIGAIGVVAVLAAAPAFAQTGDGVSVTATISGPYGDGTHLVRGSVVPTFPPLDQPGEIRTASVSVYVEIMGDQGGRWPVEYDWFNHALACDTIGERCITDDERNGIGLVGAGALTLETPDPLVSGQAIPFEERIVVPDDATQIRVVAQLRHTWRGSATFWDAIHYTWDTAGPVSVDDVSATGLPPEYAGGAIGVTAALAALIAAALAATTASAAGAATGGLATGASPGASTAPTLVDPDTGEVLPVDGGHVWYGEWMSPAEAQLLIDQRIGEIQLDQQAAAQFHQFVQQQRDQRRQELDQLGFEYDADTNTWKPGTDTLQILDQRWQQQIDQDPEWQQQRKELQEIQQLINADKKQLLMAHQASLAKDFEFHESSAKAIEVIETTLVGVKKVADTTINVLGEIPGGPRYIKWAYNATTNTIEHGVGAGVQSLAKDVICDVAGDGIDVVWGNGNLAVEISGPTSYYQTVLPNNVHLDPGLPDTFKDSVMKVFGNVEQITGVDKLVMNLDTPVKTLLTKETAGELTYGVIKSKWVGNVYQHDLQAAANLGTGAGRLMEGDI